MKPRHLIPNLLIAAALTASSGFAGAQEMPTEPEPEASNPDGANPGEDGHPVREIRMLPDHKRMLVLHEEERNPYSRRTPEAVVREAEEKSGETEADRIRRVLTELRVSGKTHGDQGIRLLAGDIIFETGRFLPKVLEDQTEILRVEHVTDDTITIGWVDPATGEPTGNRLDLTYNLETTVRQVLAGQPYTGDRGESGLKFGVFRRDDPSDRIADRRKKPQPGNEKDEDASGRQLGDATPEAFEPGE